MRRRRSSLNATMVNKDATGQGRTSELTMIAERVMDKYKEKPRMVRWLREDMSEQPWSSMVALKGMRRE